MGRVSSAPGRPVDSPTVQRLTTSATTNGKTWDGNHSGTGAELQEVGMARRQAGRQLSPGSTTVIYYSETTDREDF